MYLLKAFVEMILKLAKIKLGLVTFGAYYYLQERLGNLI
jgi:hypothetical protein